MLAYGGDYAAAAKAHLQAGTVERALDMFTDLKLWKEARRFAEEVGAGRLDVSSLMLKQAQWCEDSGDVGAAATIYAGLGQASRAVGLLGERGLWAGLMELVRSLPSAPPSSLLLPPPPAHALSLSGGTPPGGSSSSSAGEAEAGSSSSSSARARSESLESQESMDEALLTAGMEEDGGAAAAAAAAAAAGGLTKDVKQALSAAGAYLTRAGLIPAAREVYSKLGDVRSLVQLHIDAGQWESAHRLAGETEEAVRGAWEGAVGRGAPPAAVARLARDLASARAIVSHTHLCRGEALAGLDKFEEALKAYEAGGRPDLTARILSDLAGAALEEGRFHDASLHYQRLAREAAGSLDRLCSSSSSSSSSRSEASVGALCAAGARYRRFSHYADLYAAYEVIYAATAKPFTTHLPMTVFNAARYLLNATAGPVDRGGAAALAPPHPSRPKAGSSSSAQQQQLQAAPLPGRLPARLSIVRTLYALAKTALALRGYATARRALEPLVSGALLVPPAWRDAVDVMSLQLATAPAGDAPELLVACPRCAALQPPLAATASADFVALRPAPLPPSLPPSSTLHPAASASAAASGGLAADPALATFLPPWQSAVSGDACSSCGCPFVRSSLTYEVLPLIEFLPTPGTDLVGALTLLAEEAPLDLGPAAAAAAAAVGGSAGGGQSLVFGSTGSAGAAAGGSSGEAQFKAAMAAAAERASEARARGDKAGSLGEPPRGVTAVAPAVLKLLKPSDVFLVRSPPHASSSTAASAASTALSLSKGSSGAGSSGSSSSSSSSSGAAGAAAAAAAARTSGTILQLCASGGLFPSAAEELVAPPRLYFNAAAGEVELVTSAPCGRLFHLEDLELAVLTTGYCPFSKAPAEEVGF